MEKERIEQVGKEKREKGRQNSLIFFHVSKCVVMLFLFLSYHRLHANCSFGNCLHAFIPLASSCLPFLKVSRNVPCFGSVPLFMQITPLIVNCGRSLTPASSWYKTFHLGSSLSSPSSLMQELTSLSSLSTVLLVVFCMLHLLPLLTFKRGNIWTYIPLNCYRPLESQCFVLSEATFVSSPCHVSSP